MGVRQEINSVSYPRYVTPGDIRLVTRRCDRGELWLRPSETVNNAVLYCLAYAAQETGIEVMSFLVMSNHHHAVVRDPCCNISKFMERFHGLVAHLLNVEWGRQGSFWSNDPPCPTQLINPEDVLEKIFYTLANPVSAHLVDRVGDWPGANAYTAMLSGETIVVKRPGKYFARNGSAPQEITLKLVRPPGFEGHTTEEWAKFLRTQVEHTEDSIRKYRLSKKIPILGRKGVLAASPFNSSPKILPRGKLRPDIACKNRPARIRALRKIRDFRVAHEAARKRLLDHELNVVFPYGTYRMRIMGHPCAGPP